MIRTIDKNDIPECVRVIKDSFMTVADQFGFTIINAPGFTAFAIREEKLREQYENAHRLMYAYYDVEKIVGYYALTLPKSGTCELNNLAVLPSYRHQGIGKQLLLHAFQEAKKMNCTQIKISIVEENRVLRKWYEAYGFVHRGTKKFDFFPFTCGYLEKRL